MISQGCCSGQMGHTTSLDVPKEVEARIDALIGHYPTPRCAVVMVLHELQDHFRCISPGAVEWTAAKLGLRPIQVLELVTFYPMFKQERVGRLHLRICRTLSCALAGSHAIHRQLCVRLGLDPNRHGPQTTADGRVTVEFVECLASCGTAPALMANETLHERVTIEQVEALLGKSTGKTNAKSEGELAAEHGFEP